MDRDSASSLLLDHQSLGDRRSNGPRSRFSRRSRRRRPNRSGDRTVRAIEARMAADLFETAPRHFRVRHLRAGVQPVGYRATGAMLSETDAGPGPSPRRSVDRPQRQDPAAQLRPGEGVTLVGDSTPPPRTPKAMGHPPGIRRARILGFPTRGACGIIPDAFRT